MKFLSFLFLRICFPMLNKTHKPKNLINLELIVDSDTDNVVST